MCERAGSTRDLGSPIRRKRGWILTNPLEPNAVHPLLTLSRRERLLDAVQQVASAGGGEVETREV